MHLRQIITLGLVATAAYASSAFAADPTQAPPPFILKAIGPDVYAAIDGPTGQSSSNAGFVIGDDGVLVVDSFFNPEATKALIADIHKLTSKPIRYVVNTHYHIDHVGGDAVLKQAGAIIIAHRNVRSWVRSENLHLVGDQISPQIKARVALLALPDVTTDTDLIVWLGKRKVVIHSVLGHTGGDLVIAVPDAKVVFCGDIVWHHVSPNVIDGTIGRWIDTVESLKNAADAAQTSFVPGHGDIGKVNDLADFAHYLEDLRKVVELKRAQNLTGEALVAAALPEFRRQHGDWTAFDHFAQLEIRYMDDELAGAKRTPKAAAD